MHTNEAITLTRDCEAALVPSGTKVTLERGEQAYITQALGGSYTVVVNGNMFRVEGKDSDALGLEPVSTPADRVRGKSLTQEQLERVAWDQMRTCYDPEIPVNIVDLGLIYDCSISRIEGAGNRMDVKMTLTAPGCGMGEHLRQDVQNKLLSIPGVDEVNVELVWEPQWNQAMMTEAARLELGLF
jgi:probable FeS assembly SUF system protein SufT